MSMKFQTVAQMFNAVSQPFEQCQIPPRMQIQLIKKLIIDFH